MLKGDPAVEYRLLQHAPFPAAVQDAAAVYAHILQIYKCMTGIAPGTLGANETGRPSDTYSARKSGSGSNLLNNDTVASACINKPCKIVLIGDSAGGNLVLALARWIRDEALLPPPDGLLLLSPSCDPCELYLTRSVYAT